MFQEASDILTFCKSKFPKHSGQSRVSIIPIWDCPEILILQSKSAFHSTDLKMLFASLNEPLDWLKILKFRKWIEIKNSGKILFPRTFLVHWIHFLKFRMAKMEKDWNFKKLINHVCLQDIPKISKSSIWIVFPGKIHVILVFCFCL